MMEPTTGETSVLKGLAIPGTMKVQKTITGLLLSTYKIPLISLMLFATFALCALFPATFNLGLKRQKSYRFKNDNLGFFIGDINSFLSDSNSYAETEAKMVKLFPEKMQKKVQSIIRPALILSEKHQLDPFWVLSVMWTESHFRHQVTSNKGAKGLMQIMPPTYVETLAGMKKKGIFLESDRGEDYLRYQYGHVFYELGYSQLVSKLRNLEVGIYYLKGLLKAFDNNHYYATVSYNMGPNWTRGQLRNNLPVGKKNHYLNKVLKNYYHITKTLSQTTNVTFIPRI